MCNLCYVYFHWGGEGQRKLNYNYTNTYPSSLPPFFFFFILQKQYIKKAKYFLFFVFHFICLAKPKRKYIANGISNSTIVFHWSRFTEKYGFIESKISASY